MSNSDKDLNKNDNKDKIKIEANNYFSIIHSICKIDYFTGKKINNFFPIRSFIL